MDKKLLKKLRFIADSEGISMKPVIYPHNSLYIKPISFKQIKTNDIIVFEQGNALIPHRVIYRKNKYLITKGDNNLGSDGKIYPKQIIGKVYQLKRAGRIINPENLYLVQSTLYFQEIVKIKQAFEKEKIDFVFLKGLPLHLYFEKGHPKRIYGDCDILVSPNQKKKVGKILIKLKYAPEKEIQSSLLYRFIGSEVKEKNYFKTVNGLRVIIEIHYQITFTTHRVPNPFVKLENIIKEYSHNLLERRWFVKINSVKVPVLEKNDLVFYLLLHFYTHLYNGPFRLNLVKQILQRNKINWNNILDKAKKLKMINFIIPSLFLLKKYYGYDKGYFLAKKNFWKNFDYSMKVFKFFDLEKNFFDDNHSFFKTRLMRAFLVTLYADENVFKKILIIIQPKIVLHLIYFLLLRIKWKLSFFFSTRRVNSLNPF